MRILAPLPREASERVPLLRFDDFRFVLYNAFTRRPRTFRRRGSDGVRIQKTSANAALKAGEVDSIQEAELVVKTDSVEE
jgi:hypothetical protein